MHDLLILRAEDGRTVRLELEPKQPGDKPATLPVVEIPNDSGPLRRNAKLGIEHTANFRVVKWGRETFTFSHKQSLVVESLATATASGFDFVDQHTLLDQADSDGARLLDLFRGHPAWNRFIVKALGSGPGAFTLAKPI